MTRVTVREGESWDQTLRRFNKKLKESGILAEIRQRGHFKKPSQLRRQRLAANRRRAARHVARGRP